MNGLGATLVTQFSWVLYVFGAFPVLTGVKMVWMAGHQPDLETSPLLKFLRRHLRVAPKLRGNASSHARRIRPAASRCCG